MENILDPAGRIFIALLAAGALAAGLKIRGLLRGSSLWNLFRGLLLIAIGVAVFLTAVKISLICSARGEETFYFLAPAFAFLFNFSRAWEAWLVPHAKILIPSSVILLFLIGVLSVLFSRRRGWEIFWLALGFTGTLKAQTILAQGSLAASVPFYLTALAALIVSAWSRPPDEPPGAKSRPALGIAGLILILLLALAPYFYRLEQRLWTVNDYDSQTMLSALQVYEGDRDYNRVLWAYIERDYQGGAFDPFFIYPLAFLFHFFEPALVMARSEGAFWALTAVVILYFLLKGMFGIRAALIGAFLMAFSRWFLCTTHLGLYHSQTICYAIFMIFLFERALSGRLFLYPLAGFCLAFHSYFYVPVRIVFPLLILVWLHRAVIERSLSPAHLAGFLVFLLIFLFVSDLVADPFRQLTGVSITDHYIGGQPGKGGFERGQAIQDYLANLKHLFDGTFNSYISWAFPFPDGPLFNRSLFLLATVGIGICIGRFWRGRYFLFLLWLVLAILPVTLISPWVDKGVSRRATLLIPAVASLAAITLDSLFTGIRRVFRVPGSIVAALLLIAFLSTFALQEIDAYFNRPSYTLNYHRGNREFGEKLVQHLKEGYHVDILLQRLQFSEWLLDVLAYPHVKKLYSHFGPSINIWGQPNRHEVGENPYYRFWPYEQREAALRAARSYPGKEVLMIAECEEHHPFLDVLRNSDPPVRLQEISGRDNRIVGYEYLPPTTTP